MTKFSLVPVRPTSSAVELDLDGDGVTAGGIGGWEALARPRRTAGTAWVGTPERTLSVPAILSGIDAYGSGQDRVMDSVRTKLEGLGKPTSATGEPPVLQIVGIPRVATTTRWVLQDIAAGARIADRLGRTLQEEVTLTFLEFRDLALVSSPAAKARRRQKKKKATGKKKKKVVKKKVKKK